MALTTARAGASSISETTTRAPSLANRIAVAFPIPVAEPVTMADLPFRHPLGRLSFSEFMKMPKIIRLISLKSLQTCWTGAENLLTGRTRKSTIKLEHRDGRERGLRKL